MRESDVRSTPAQVFDPLHSQYTFTLDVCANETNHKLPRWYGPGGLVEDALSVAWSTDERIWMNPPYSRGLQRRFVEKAVDCARRGGFVTALLPADTSTKLFHELIWRHWPVTFLKGRIKFNGMPTAAKFGSMIVRFDGRRGVS